MNCMRCGREIALGQAFCKECLADMERHPVNPGTPVQLPPPMPNHPHRRVSHSRKVKKPEEQIARLRRLVRIQTIAFVIAVLALIGSTIFFMKKLYPEQVILPGQNYRSIGETTGE